MTAINATTITLTDRDFDRIAGFVYTHCGIKMSRVKKVMMESRLAKRLRNLELHSFSDYIDLVFDPERGQSELVRMIDLLTTNKTDFFREPHHFDFLANRVLPEWQGPHNRPMRLWSAGCSTGEEAYTMAMVMADYCRRHPGMQYSILATDLSTDVLGRATQAIYDEDRADPIPPTWRKQYLLRSRDPRQKKIRIAPELRRRVVFRRLNLMDAHYGFNERQDVIFCRNVMIYFDRPTQETLVNHFAAHLQPGGYLFIGHSETLHGLDTPLRLIKPTIYRKEPC